MQAHRQGAIETAERLCLDVLELAPDRPGALSVLYEIRKAQGKPRAAEALIRRIVALDPNNLVATNELALILLGKGSLAEAEVARPQRRPHRPGEPAGAQPDGHDHDGGEPAADRRIPLPPRAGPQRRSAIRSCSPTSPGT